MSSPKNFYCRMYGRSWESRSCWNVHQCPECERIVKERQQETERLIREQKCETQKQGPRFEVVHSYKRFKEIMGSPFQVKDKP